MGDISDASDNSETKIDMTPSTNMPVETQPEPVPPRVVRVVSDEENLASILHYVEPMEKSNLFVFPPPPTPIEPGQAQKI